MSKPKISIVGIALVAALAIVIPAPSSAHRSGCHSHLTCPCLQHGVGGTKPPPSSNPPAGDGPAVFKGRCKRGRLPDYRCTPGTVFRNVTVHQICTPGYTKRVRNVSQSLKERVYLSYG